MKNKYLDIWAIQKLPEELYNALKNIKSDVTIFENALCEFRVGGKVLKSRQFDKIIYSEESDTVVFLMRDGVATLEQAEKYFDENGIDYNKITLFKNKRPYENDLSIKEFWFARDLYVVEDAVEDSKNRGNTSCVYDENEQASLTFRYVTESNKQYQIFKINFCGMIEFDDKIILITHSRTKNDLTSPAILDCLEEKGIEIKNSLSDEDGVKF